MPEGALKKKAKERELSGERKPIQIIIGDPLPSTSSFVEEQVIKLDPKIERAEEGSLDKPVVIESRTKPSRKRGSTISAPSQKRRSQSR